MAMSLLSELKKLPNYISIKKDKLSLFSAVVTGINWMCCMPLIQALVFGCLIFSFRIKLDLFRFMSYTLFATILKVFRTKYNRDSVKMEKQISNNYSVSKETCKKISITKITFRNV